MAFTLDGKPLAVDVPFTVGEINYPANWLRLTTKAEKEAIGIKEVDDPKIYDSRFYMYDGTAKALDDKKETDEDGIEETINNSKEIEVCYRSNGQGSENIIDNCAVDASIKLSEDFTGTENEVIRIGFLSKSKSWTGTVLGEQGNIINTVVSQTQVESIQLKNEAKKLGLPVHEVIARRKQEEECVTDWTRCRNNEQFVNVSEVAKDARYDCADEARKMARPRDLDLSLIPFSSYMSGVDYIKDGVALFIDPNASMENDFGAEMSVTLECYYSLNEMKVTLVNMR